MLEILHPDSDLCNAILSMRSNNMDYIEEELIITNLLIDQLPMIATKNLLSFPT